MPKNYVIDFCNFLTAKVERGNITARNTEELESKAYPHRVERIVSCGMPSEN